ncbi:MAG: DUF1926 domain-containing protein [Candidatus Hydrogenedentes bacterium]|nr:DUF1926 domain-containing protein [Candidatus Hydrogenedentota bacterium]
MKSINLIFGCHAHQPVGNFDFVFEESYHKAYRPFLHVLERYPAVRVTLHFTGPLFDWFEAHAPEFLERIAALVDRGQVEIMGGGYYEPMLCAIPERDARQQILRMQQFCERHFGRVPKGMWLTERVWEPHLARILSQSGVEYTALDDAHFLCSGLRPEDMYGYYMTEDGGHTLKVFPILEKLRYLVPFHQVHETIEYLRECATEEGTRCAVLHDDYEKFGVWPGTHSSVYTEGWLEEFFQALTDNQDWLHCLTYEQYLMQASSQGRTYITCASYDEMMTWALPTPMQRKLNNARQELKKQPDLDKKASQFMRGGFWRSFLAKYDEANNIQKRMLRTSARLERLAVQYANDERMKEAERLLHQGQCNCAYWHGVFGGLYLNHLRTALYEKIIGADQVMDQIEGLAGEYVSFEATDFDADGNVEGILENAHLSLFFNPVDGGTLFELDYKTVPFNFGNVLTRRDEVYHDQLREGSALVGQETQGDQSIHEMVKAKEADLDKLLVYDPYRRVSFRDHLISDTATVDTFWNGTETELCSIYNASYSMESGTDWVAFSAQGVVAGEESVMARVRKKIELLPGASHFEVTYDLSFDKPLPEGIIFGFEFLVNLLTGDALDRYYHSDDVDMGGARLGSRGVLNDISHIAARDDWQHIELGLRFSRPARLYRFPIDTVSQSEGGQERVHQGCVLLPCWSVSGVENQQFSLVVRLEINSTVK